MGFVIDRMRYAYLVYQIDEDEKIDEDQVNCLQYAGISYIMKCQHEENLLLFERNEGLGLEDWLRLEVKGKDRDYKVYRLVCHIVEAISQIEEYPFLSTSHLDLSIERLYVSKEDQVGLVYLPVNKSFKSIRSGLKDLIQDLLIKVEDPELILKFHKLLRELEDHKIDFSEIREGIMISQQNKANKVLSSKDQKTSIELHLRMYNRDVVYNIEKDSFIIGRDDRKCDLAIGDPTVSRKHAIIESCGDEYKIRDLSTKNHTFVNEQTIVAGEELALRSGDIIRIGEQEISFIRN